MASPTRRTWDWVSSRSWWWSRKPGVLQSMGSQRVRHDWATELNWTEATSSVGLPAPRLHFVSWLLCPYLCIPSLHWFLVLSLSPVRLLWPHGVHYLPEFTQIYVHWVSDTIQPSHPLLPPSSLPSVFQSLFQWVSCSHQVAKVLEFQPQHHSFQGIFRVDFLWDWLPWLATVWTCPVKLRQGHRGWTKRVQRPGSSRSPARFYSWVTKIVVQQSSSLTWIISLPLYTGYSCSPNILSFPALKILLLSIFFSSYCVYVCVSCSCPTFTHVQLFATPMDCGLPGSFVHCIFQARLLEQVAISSSRWSSQPRDQTWVSHIAGRFFTIWTTRKVPGTVTTLILFSFNTKTHQNSPFNILFQIYFLPLSCEHIFSF